MSGLRQIISMAATDPEFRTSLLADPKSALAQRGLEASAEELKVLSEERHLLELSPQKLLALMLASADGPYQLWPVVPRSKRYATSSG